ncbi:MAG: sulfite exporter TauE/SafE family protein, partial [Novosphingobium sp.]
MDVFASFDMMHAVAGFFVGVMVGLTGVGGGSLMTPILVLIFHQNV